MVATGAGFAFTAMFNASTAKPSLKGAAEMDKIESNRERNEVEDLEGELSKVEDALLGLANMAEDQHATEIHRWADTVIEMVHLFMTEVAERLEEYEER